MKVPVIENYTNDAEYISIKIAKPFSVERSYLIVNDKDRVKLIKTVERIVRSSLEYKQYIQFLKSEIDMTCCSFFNNINSDTRVRLEIHHEPFTLFDITNIIVNWFIKNEEPLNPILIAEKVMAIHYKNLVGLVPLSITCHGLVHDGRLLIPLQCVYGDFMSFLEEYYEYIPEDVLEALQAKVDLSKDVQVDTSILKKKYTYITVDGFTLPEVIK